MILPGSYSNGFAPRDGQPLYPELWRGCVGAWAPCLGPTGSTLRDWSGYGRHGTLTNMDPGTDWAVSRGKVGLNFDGTNDLIVCQSAINLQQDSPFSIEATIAPSSLSADRTIISTWDFGVAAGWRLNITGGFLEAALLSSVGVGRRIAATSALSLNALQHVCCTYDGSSDASGFQLFVNGLRLSVTVNDNANPGTLLNAKMHIGRLVTNDYWFAGDIYSLSVVRRQLAVKEIGILASRPGIAYDLAPRRRSRIFTGGFKAYWAARKAQIIGGGLN